MQVNGKTCYNKKLAAGSGKQLCGSKNNGWNEEKIKVKCSAPAVNGQFTLRVTTQLNSAANDESFGIDNVVLKKVTTKPPGFKTITANFQDAKDFEGLDCRLHCLIVVFCIVYVCEFVIFYVLSQSDVRDLRNIGQFSVTTVWKSVPRCVMPS